MNNRKELFKVLFIRNFNADLHDWLKMEAIRQGTTLTNLVYRVLKDYQRRKEEERKEANK